MPEVRLIDANALKKDIDTSLLYGLCVCFDEIVERQPTIDAEPVRYGRWIEGTSRGSYSIYCSYCGSHKETICPSDYCPDCGADMREVSEDAGTD